MNVVIGFAEDVPGTKTVPFFVALRGGFPNMDVVIGFAEDVSDTETAPESVLPGFPCGSDASTTPFTRTGFCMMGAVLPRAVSEMPEDALDLGMPAAPSSSFTYWSCSPRMLPVELGLFI
eukprot:CAMPEP_0170606840 /NCGR_PEP_ID=MMETSP0224-20130122/20735_1 /TAXON_ID=285029 /ORGANISM="Togula jolla, Strain CCCM 725" /LENGTH=119 /DNA_ID=CAMNT_0010931965 /DNA_START=762 /DNA_END=1121 /DNA_ORIENTATION=-